MVMPHESHAVECAGGGAWLGNYKKNKKTMMMMMVSTSAWNGDDFGGGRECEDVLPTPACVGSSAVPMMMARSESDTASPPDGWLPGGSPIQVDSMMKDGDDDDVAGRISSVCEYVTPVKCQRPKSQMRAPEVRRMESMLKPMRTLAPREQVMPMSPSDMSLDVNANLRRTALVRVALQHSSSGLSPGVLYPGGM